MDNFRWLDEQDSSNKPNWFKHYWLHITAGVVIVVLLGYLIFGVGTSEEPSAVEPPVATEVTTKKITLRLPDQTTKIIDPDQPNTLYRNDALRGTDNGAPNPAPTERSLSLAPLAETLTLSKEENYTKTTAPTAPTNTMEPPRRVSRLISPGTSVPSSTPPKATEQVPLTDNSAATQKISPPRVQPAETLKAMPAAPITAVPQVSPPTGTVTADLHELLQRQSSHYTLQLFASHDEKIVRRFIAQNALAGKAVYAKIRQNSQDWYIVLMGDYVTREQALNAIAQLPSVVQTQNPWARSIQSVQDAIRKRLAYGD